MTKIISAILLTSCVLWVGCASVQSSNPLDPAAKKFQPAAGKASLYINREGDMRSGATTLQILLDGRAVGLLPSDTYQWLSVDPGEHVLKIRIASGEQEEMSPGYTKTNPQVKFTVAAGENCFFRANLRFGQMKTQLNLLQISSKEGRIGVQSAIMAP